MLEQAKTCHNIFQKNYLIQNAQLLQQFYAFQLARAVPKLNSLEKVSSNKLKDAALSIWRYPANASLTIKSHQTGTTHSSTTHKFYFIRIVGTNLLANYSSNEISQEHTNCNIKGEHRPSCQIPCVGCCTKMRYLERKY